MLQGYGLLEVFNLHADAMNEISSVIYIHERI